MEHVEILASKSAGKQIERSKSGYKPSKIAQKMFADLFVYSGADFELVTWTSTDPDSPHDHPPCDPWQFSSHGFAA